MTVNFSGWKLSDGRKFKKLNMAEFDIIKSYESKANKNEDVTISSMHFNESIQLMKIITKI